jgi:hypothetical protein
MDDTILQHCNETELLGIARKQGLGLLRRGIPRETLLGLVAGTVNMAPEYVSGTIETRKLLEKHIYDHFSVTRSQLPGCNGHCPTYGCSEGRHAVCFSPNAEGVQ